MAAPREGLLASVRGSGQARRQVSMINIAAGATRQGADLSSQVAAAWSMLDRTFHIRTCSCVRLERVGSGLQRQSHHLYFPLLQFDQLGNTSTYTASAPYLDCDPCWFAVFETEGLGRG